MKLTLDCPTYNCSLRENVPILSCAAVLSPEEDYTPSTKPTPLPSPFPASPGGNGRGNSGPPHRFLEYAKVQS